MPLALITGGRGFIGRYLGRLLQRQGINVCGIGHGAWTETERENYGIRYWLNGDVTKRNLDVIQSAVGRPDRVFHLAGGSSVAASLVTPEEDFRRSVIAAAELLEWARVAAPEAKIVFSSSAAVYGNGHCRAIPEAGPLSPQSPYGFHKRMSEELFESYAKTFQLSVAIVRLFSVYGEELKKQLLWDACSRLARNARSLELGGTGVETRDWLHVSDAVELLEAVSKRASPDCLIVNGGTGLPTTVRQVAEELCIEWGDNTSLTFNGISRIGDPSYLVADTSRVAFLKLQPRITWKAGVRMYVQWFKCESLGTKG